MTIDTPAWTAAPPERERPGVVLTFATTGAGQAILLNVTLDDLQRVLDAARPLIDRHRTMRDSLDAGSFDRAASHATVAAFERIRAAADQAGLAQ